MTFDNGRTIIKLRIRLFIATVIMTAYIFVVYFGKLLRFPIFGIQEYHATLVLVGAYIILTFLPVILKYKYIYFSDDGQKIIFRYYSAGFLSGQKNSVEIPKSEFLGYKLLKKFPGLIKSIQLYRLMGNKKASYPPVYISSLTKSEINKIRAALDKYVKQN
ncbi:MAG: hypothetical protein JW965_07550 [Bacteroidales bacterium]|nr:hypothetical protein [Bacteroidales bacterium]